MAAPKIFQTVPNSSKKPAGPFGGAKAIFVKLTNCDSHDTARCGMLSNAVPKPGFNSPAIVAGLGARSRIQRETAKSSEPFCCYSGCRTGGGPGFPPRTRRRSLIICPETARTGAPPKVELRRSGDCGMDTPAITGRQPPVLPASPAPRPNQPRLIEASAVGRNLPPAAKARHLAELIKSARPG